MDVSAAWSPAAPVAACGASCFGIKASRAGVAPCSSGREGTEDTFPPHADGGLERPSRPLTRDCLMWPTEMRRLEPRECRSLRGRHVGHVERVAVFRERAE